MPQRKGTPWSEARRAACTPEYRAHLSEVKKGAVPWNKGDVGGRPGRARRPVGPRTGPGAGPNKGSGPGGL